MLNFNDVPYIGFHGNRTGIYNFNIASYLSHRHNKPASSIIRRCTFDTKVIEEILLDEGFSKISSHEYATLDDSLKVNDFIEHLSKEEKNKYLLESSRTETYSNKDETVMVQVIRKEYETKIEEEMLFVDDIETLEMGFFEPDRARCEMLLRNILEKSYRRGNKTLDDEEAIIGIIGSTPEGMYIKEYNLGKNAKMMTNEEMDLHYGQEFSEFHDNLSRLLKSDNKGLIIFHGDPGTGKTYYIRMLLKDLVKSKKNVIYVPSNFMDSFLDPNFITFLSDWILEQNNPTIILLEDAESLVESRDSGVRSLGISNLLNITDGILNDILGTQIILTFNTQLDYIDTALLRPERLLARKEFTSLTTEESNDLLKHLGIDHVTDKEMSLADIYSMKNNRKILYHNIKEKKSKVGFFI